MQLFPGRFPEDFDRMDWPRFMRARDVEQLVQTERKRMGMMDGSLQAKDLSRRELMLLALHERLLSGED